MAPPTRTPRATWIEAGLRMLSAGGPDAVRIEPLAEALGVSRGGFYWHFDNRETFLAEMLDAYERAATGDTLAEVERRGGDPRTRIQRAGALTLSERLLPIDLAVRDWARRDADVAARLRRVDNRRMEYLRLLIGEFIDDAEDVEARGMLAFALAIGNHFIAADHNGSSRKQVLERATHRLLG
jgi:AcrR family transcriptional regulator